MAYGHGGFHAELERVSQQIAAEPDHAEHWFHRAQWKYHHGDWESSLKDLAKTEQLAPGKFPVDLVRGEVCLAAGKLKTAKQALDRFILRYPAVGEGFVARARVLRKLGQLNQASADFTSAIALSKNPEPDLYLEAAGLCAERKQKQEAITILQAGVQKFGAIPALADKALELELSLGRYDDALARVESMRKSAPRPEPWLAKKASILAQAGRLQESRSAWLELRDRLLAMSPNQRGSHAMSVLLEQSQVALSSLSQTLPADSPQPPSP